MDEPSSPTSRALRTLDLLQRHPGITAAQLGEHLGVSDRAARRYVQMLREAEIPVQSEPGRYGGYRLGRGLRLPPLVFSGAEALALVMAALAGRDAVADTDGAVGTAMAKIVRALPPDVGRTADLVREHALAVPSRVDERPQSVITSELVRAVADHHRVRCGYRSASGSAFTIEVDPWAVVVRHGLWYLLCHDHGPGAVRTYRIDRVSAVQTLDARFQPPADLDPVATLEQHLGSGREFACATVFAAPYTDVRPWIGPAMGQLEPVDDDHCRLVGTTSNPDMYAGEWLSALPFDFSIEGGPELVAAVRSVGERMLRGVPTMSSAARAGQF